MCCRIVGLCWVEYCKRFFGFIRIQQPEELAGISHILVEVDRIPRIHIEIVTGNGETQQCVLFAAVELAACTSFFETDGCVNNQIAGAPDLVKVLPVNRLHFTVPRCQVFESAF